MPRSVDTDIAVLPSGVTLNNGLALQVIPNELIPPPPERMLRWIRTSDGAMVAYIFGESDASGDGLTINAAASDPAHVSQVTINALPDISLSTGSQLFLQSEGGGFDASTLLAVGAFQALLLDDSGRSDYPQFSNIQVFSAVGPVPIGWNVTIRSSTAIFLVCGSAFDTAVGRHVGLPIVFDFVQRAGFDMFFNIANCHMAFVPRIFKLTGLTPGVKQLTINASGSSVITDNNDFFFAAVLN